MRNAAAAVLLLLASAGAHAAAQDPRLVRLDPESRAAVSVMIDSAHARGLPAEPLVDRALEGAAKHASRAAIIAAVRRLFTELRGAREALGDAASAAELEAGAAALRAGAEPAMLIRLRRSRPHQPLTVPLAVLADLVTQGVPADTASAAVEALAAFTQDDDLIEFRRSVERDIALGAPPAAAVAVRAGSLADALPDRPAAPPRRP